jgi:hypothetical protein
MLKQYLIYIFIPGMISVTLYFICGGDINSELNILYCARVCVCNLLASLF